MASFSKARKAVTTCFQTQAAAMRRPRWWYVAAIGTQLLPSCVLAQSTCPPGKYQATPAGIPGPVICAPIAHDRDGRVVAPPPRASHWGAIASDRTATHVATSDDLPNKQDAEKAALASCGESGGVACSVAIAYGNGCGALVASARDLVASADATKKFAREAAMHQCSTNSDAHCHVVLVACSDPSSDH